MNNTQLTFLLILTSAVLICGCDVVTGAKSKAERNASLSKAAALNNEIETLKDQNNQLAKMLEESESKLAIKVATLDQTEKQLQVSLSANADLEARLLATNNQLKKVGELAGQIEASFKANTANLERQIQSLGQILPQTTDAKDAEQDPAAEQTAENSDDHGEKK